MLLPDAEPTEVVARLATLDDAALRVSWASRWARHNYSRSGASAVTVFGLGELLGASDLTPQAGEICSLCAPLAFTRDDPSFDEAVRLVDGMRATLERLGPSADFVRLQLLLASGLLLQGRPEPACDRAIDAYLFSLNVDEASTRCECLGHLVAFLGRHAPRESVLRTAGLDEAQGELESSFAVLLADSASHGIVCGGPVLALAGGRIDLAEHFVEAVNTSDRRDDLRAKVFNHLLLREGLELDAEALFALAEKVEDPFLRGECVERFVAGWDRKPHGRAWTFPVFELAVRMLPKIREAEARARAACKLLGIAKDRVGRYQAYEERLAETAREACQSVSALWDRVRIGFEIAASLAPHSRADASIVLGEAMDLKQSLMVASRASAVAIKASLLLVASAASCLVPKGLLNPDTDLAEFDELVQSLPSEGEQAGIWSDLATRLFLLGEEEWAAKLVAGKVRPLLDRVSALDGDYRDELFIEVSYALFRCNRTLFFEEISRQHPSIADRALFNVARTIAERTPVSEPCDELRDPSAALGYDQLVMLCDLAGRIEVDVLVFRVCEMVARVVVSDRHDEKFTREQRGDVASRLRAVGRARFPARRFIQHEGYAVLLEAMVLELEREKSGVRWQAIAARAQELPNRADQAFVLSFVAKAMPSRLDGLRRQTVQAATDVIAGLASLYDRVERTKTLADAVLSFDAELARHSLRTAMESSKRIRALSVDTLQRSIVDLADRIDPGLASSLARLVDDDPARRRQRRPLLRGPPHPRG